jgi:hypothetical protein
VIRLDAWISSVINKLKGEFPDSNSAPAFDQLHAKTIVHTDVATPDIRPLCGRLNWIGKLLKPGDHASVRTSLKLNPGELLIFEGFDQFDHSCFMVVIFLAELIKKNRAFLRGFQKIRLDGDPDPVQFVVVHTEKIAVTIPKCKKLLTSPRSQTCGPLTTPEKYRNFRNQCLHFFGAVFFEQGQFLRLIGLRHLAKFTMPFHIIRQADQSVGKSLRYVSVFFLTIKGKREFPQGVFNILGVHECTLTQPPF